MAAMMQRIILGLLALILVACNNQIGPNPELLHGTWLQNGATQADPTLIVDQAVITYRADGTSDFDAIMTYSGNAGIPERFVIDAAVNWTLEETILTRTLQDVTVTPDIATPDAQALAAQLEEAYRNSPPGRLIVEQVDGETMALLDAATGQILTYRKQTAE